MKSEELSCCRQAGGRQAGRHAGEQAGRQAGKQAGRQAGQTGEKSSMSAQSQKIEFPVFKSMVLRLCFELEIFQIFWPERCLAFLEGILSCGAGFCAAELDSELRSCILS